MKKYKWRYVLLAFGLLAMACEKEETETVVPDEGSKTSVTEVSGYPVVDTDQNQCFDNTAFITAPAAGADFYGQDAQINGNQMDYTLSEDELTVYDNVTGLTWMRSGDTDDDGDIDADDNITYASLDTYIANRNKEAFGGYSDWRLPSMKELYSLMNFKGTDPMNMETTNGIPFVDINYFIFEYGDVNGGDRIIDAQYWSSNVYTGTVMNGVDGAFGLNLADGRIKCYPIGGIQDKGKRVMLCRGNTEYGINNFVDNGDKTISDKATGLMWTKDDSGDGVNNGPRSGMLWKEALAYVQQKNGAIYLGHNDWRLPNAKEMQSIVDYTRGPDISQSGAIDPVFNITQITNEDGQVDFPWFWTSTTHVREDGNASSGVYITFGRAMGYWQNQWTDVHGAGCQRSDNKAGDFSMYTFVLDGYYFAKSPQGDATRSYNYVRLVRDID